MGHHHGHPLTGPWDYVPTTEARPWESHLEIPKDLRTDTDQTFLINQTDSACIHTIYIHIRKNSRNPPLPFSQPNHANSLFSNPEYGTLSHAITMPH